MIRSGLVLDGTYSVKEFKQNRRKRDLCAKENVLTNYFCIHFKMFHFLDFNFVFLGGDNVSIKKKKKKPNEASVSV